MTYVKIIASQMWDVFETQCRYVTDTVVDVEQERNEIILNIQGVTERKHHIHARNFIKY